MPPASNFLAADYDADWHKASAMLLMYVKFAAIILLLLGESRKTYGRNSLATFNRASYSNNGTF
jgi:hypothetical protein